jgi:hypothetical protein
MTREIFWMILATNMLSTVNGVIFGCALYKEAFGERRELFVDCSRS